MHRTLGVLAVLSGIPFTAGHAQPATPVRLVVDTLYGTPVADPYRWLENSDSEEVRQWFRAQGDHAREILDALPGRNALLERIRAIGATAPPDVSLPHEAGSRWFYTVRAPGEGVARGFVRDPSTGGARLLVDPAAVGGGGEVGANALSSFLPSPDGRLVLYGVAAGGSENSVLRVRDVETARDLEGPIERNFLAAYNAWSPDGRAFFYLRLRDLPPDAPPTELYRGTSVFRHRVGNDAVQDDVLFSPAMVGHDDRLFPFVDIDARSGQAFGILNSGVDHHVSAFFIAAVGDLARDEPSWRPLFSFADSVGSVVVDGNYVYARTRKGNVRGRIVRMHLDAPDLATAETIFAPEEGSIEDMLSARDGLYVELFSEGANKIVRIPWGGRPEPIPVPPETSVGELRTSPRRPGAFLTVDSWTSVARAYRYDPSVNALEELPIRTLGPHDYLPDARVETLFAPSHDGVRVPLTFVQPSTFARDGSHPVLLTGYGAYGTTDTPVHLAERGPWYRSGGAIAVCHVRGGGYYGGPWHEAGRMSTKPNTWLDFIACAEHLVREGYTRPERLVALGGSAGGITVGRAITDRPELFAAAVMQGGLADAVRFEKTPGGPGNTHEFGSVATEEGFRALLEMSAFHHVEPNTAYPAVLLTTGLNDGRMPPWQPGKLAAALQAATTSGDPVLLRVDEAEGHFLGNTDEQRRQVLADVYAFAMAHTELPPYRLPAPEARR